MVTNSSSDTLHIPSGIRFECSGCGNCCLQWPVPATASDVERIEALVPSPTRAAAAIQTADLDKALYSFLRRYQSGVGGFRPLSVGDQRFRGFTHVLEKRADGKCQFLTESNTCALHTTFGASSKPAMCQLFPHAFSKTPSGVFAYVSFASSGVLFNHGRPLIEQEELLRQRLVLYNELFPNAQPDWSMLQILDGHRLRWPEFLDLDAELVRVMQTDSSDDALSRLIACSRLVQEALPRYADPERLPPMEAPAATIDRVLLKHLALTYLPDDVFNTSDFEFPIQSIMKDIVAPHAVSYDGINFGELSKFHLGALDEQSEDLLRRYAYARLFAKLYLGPNLAHLSLLAGIHHLFFVLALVRLRAKQKKLATGNLQFADVAETVRVIERRLSQMNFSAQASAVMEVLFSSPARLQRVLELVS